MEVLRSHLVSIVIRNYNYARFLSDAIESALAQTYPAIQIVIADDGSTDDSLTVIQKYAAYCTVVLREHRGEGAAVNAGFGAAKGQIVIFLDSDDVLSPDAAGTIVELWRPSLARVHFPLRIMNEQGLMSTVLHPPFRMPVMPLGAYLEIYGDAPSGAQSCNAYAAWALRRILPLDPVCWSRAPDAYLNALTTGQGDISVIQFPLGGYRIHSSNLALINSMSVAVETDVTLTHIKLHAAVQEFFGDALWSSMRARLPTYHWMHRLLSQRLNPGHPFSADRVTALAWRCLTAILRRPHTSLLRRLILIAGVFGACVLPRILLARWLKPALRLARSLQYPVRFTSDHHWRAVGSPTRVPQANVPVHRSMQAEPASVDSP